MTRKGRDLFLPGKRYEYRLYGGLGGDKLFKTEIIALLVKIFFFVVMNGAH